MNKLLVTGGTGFIGSELIPNLVDKWKVFSLERYVTGRYAKSYRNVRTVFGDMRDANTINKLIKDIQPDTVIHLAAFSPVSYSYDHPQEVLHNNILGLVNLAEACRTIPHFKQFLFAGTSEEYGNNGYEIQKEDNPRYPESPYAVSKVACELYLKYMKDAYNFPYTILRPFNTYSRIHDHHFLVESTIYQMLTNEESIDLIDPTPVRDLMYISDHVNAYLTCLDNEYALEETFNFCTGIGYTIKEVVELIAKLTFYDGKINWYTKPSRPTESRVIIGDHTKATIILDWYPKVTLREGLKLTIDKWKNKLRKEK